MSGFDPAVYKQKVEQAAAYLSGVMPGFVPEVGLVLGSGLGAFADEIQDRKVIPYKDIPNFHVSSVMGHAGRLVAGTLEGRRVVAMQGRIHLYEGHSALDVVLPVRALRLWGASKFVITNAAGSLRPDLKAGSLMLLDDQMNLQGENCLSGPNIDAWGPRFPDMTCAYDKDLMNRLVPECRKLGIGLERGVYVGLRGPTYETPAEVRMYGKLGADAVGMSTVQETIALRHMGASVLGISCITNMASGLSAGLLSHDEVAETAIRVAADFATVIRVALRLC